MSHTTRDAVEVFEKFYPDYDLEFYDLVSNFSGLEIFVMWFWMPEEKDRDIAFVCFYDDLKSAVYSDKELFAELTRRLPKTSTSISTLMREVVASVCFLAIVSTLIFIVVYRTLHGVSTSDVVIIGFLSLVASGSALFFRHWIPFGTSAKQAVDPPTKV